MDLFSKDPKSGIHNLSEAVGTVLVLAIAMSIYAYFRLSTNPGVYKYLVLLLAFLELVQLIVLLRTYSILDLGFVTAYFVVCVSLLFGVNRDSLFDHPVLLFATIFYRPCTMRHGNRRVAFALSLLILGVVLPVTTGVVTDSSGMEMFALLYALLVLCLWALCTESGIKAIDWIKN